MAKNCCVTFYVNLDCSDYPKNIPIFSMDKCPVDLWPVRPGGRKECKEFGFIPDSTSKLYKNFTDVYKNGINDTNIAKAISEGLQTLGKKGWTTEKVMSTSSKKVLDAYGKTDRPYGNGTRSYVNYELHHKRPHWAKGSNNGENLVPLTETQHDKTHKWWNEKLKKSQKKNQQQMKQCIKQNLNSGANANKCDSSFTNENKKKNCGFYESGFPSLAQCLKKNYNVNVAVKMKCPKAC